MPTRSQQYGFSLVEILLVIGIIAVLSIAAFVIYPQVKTASMVEQERKNVLALFTGASQLTNGRYTGLTLPILNQAGLVPATWTGGDKSATATFNSAWGKSIGIKAEGSWIAVWFNQTPKEICVKLVPAFLTVSRQVDVGHHGGEGGDMATVYKGATGAQIAAACPDDPSAVRVWNGAAPIITGG